MDIRLPTLDYEEGKNCISYDVNTFDNTSYKLSSQQEEGGISTSSSSSSSLSSLWKTRGRILNTLKEDVLVRTLSSLDIFTSFPKDSLMNYLMLCMLLSWISSSTTLLLGNNIGNDGGGWKVVKEQWLPWWKIGLFGINNGNGDGDSSSSSSSIGMDAKMISLRLFTLHWIIMFIKGMSALLLSW